MKKAMLAVAFVGGLVFAQTENDFNVTLTKDGQGVVITKYTGKVTQVVIPAQIQGMPVREIGNRAFTTFGNSGMTRITSVVIPEGVTLIGEAAFFEQNNLASVTMPPSVTEIGNQAFSALSSPASNITEITLPASLSRAGNSIFYRCSKLEKVTIPEGVRVIGEYMFSNTTIKTISIPSTVTIIGAGAFRDAKQLENITLPLGITTIDTEVFRNCDALTSIIVPEGVTKIGESAFYGCDVLTSFTLPSAIQEIGAFAFNACPSLVTVTIPDSVKQIKFAKRSYDASVGFNFSSCPKLNLASQAALKRVGYTEGF